MDHDQPFYTRPLAPLYRERIAQAHFERFGGSIEMSRKLTMHGSKYGLHKPLAQIIKQNQRFSTNRAKQLIKQLKKYFAIGQLQ